jgi:hypothetical protein
MMLTWEKQNILRETSPSATLSTTNLTWTGLVLNPAVCGESLET